VKRTSIFSNLNSLFAQASLWFTLIPASYTSSRFINTASTGVLESHCVHTATPDKLQGQYRL